MFEILTAGQKLKKLRKELGLTQAQLASDAISREFISMVENDLRNLSLEVSLTLMKHMQSEANKKKVRFPYDNDYLTISSEEELNRYVARIDVNQTTTTELKKTLDYSIKLNCLFSQAKLLNYLAGKYTTNFDLSFYYLTRAKDIYIKLEEYQEVVKINNNLGVLCMNNGQDREATRYLILALDSSEYSLPEREMSSVIHNLVLLYIRLGEYQNCLRILDKSQEQKLINDTSELSSVLLVLRAIALAETDRRKEAIALIERVSRRKNLSEQTYHYIQTNKIFILRKIDLMAAIREQKLVTRLSESSKHRAANLILLGDLYFENSDWKISLLIHKMVLSNSKYNLALHDQMALRKKIINELITLNLLTREELTPMIDFFEKNHFRNELVEACVKFLMLSTNLDKDDAKIVGILNKVI